MTAVLVLSFSPTVLVHIELVCCDNVCARACVCFVPAEVLPSLLSLACAEHLVGRLGRQKLFS